MKSKTKISKDLKFKRNPRKITDAQLELLRNHLSELGDLSGVIYCHNNKAYVGGNQRSDVFDNSQIEITERFSEPTKQKTIAHGFIVWQGEKYAYREVVFTESEFKKACIVANHDGGSWDFDVLRANFDIPELAEWGFEVPEFETVQIPHFPITPKEAFKNAGNEDMRYLSEWLKKAAVLMDAGNYNGTKNAKVFKSVKGKTSGAMSTSLLSWDRCSCTICKSEISETGIIHPDRERYISISEAKRIGSFPDRFLMTGKRKDKWARIGNSVPPLFMRSIAKHIRTEILNKCQHP